MAVTYKSDLADDISRVRFALRDMSDGSGPLPNNANFSDGEIEELIALEGGWRCAVAAAFEALASAWSKYPTKSGDGESIARSDITRHYTDAADRWRSRCKSTEEIGVAVMAPRPLAGLSGGYRW